MLQQQLNSTHLHPNESSGTYTTPEIVSLPFLAKIKHQESDIDVLRSQHQALHEARQLTHGACLGTISPRGTS